MGGEKVKARSKGGMTFVGGTILNYLVVAVFRDFKYCFSEFLFFNLLFLVLSVNVLILFHYVFFSFNLKQMELDGTFLNRLRLNSNSNQIYQWAILYYQNDPTFYYVLRQLQKLINCEKTSLR